MKNMLIDQSSEYDCGPTCLVNAVRFLFEREEILPGVLKHIWLMGNDTYCDQGRVGCRGTSKAAMRYMAAWMKEFGRGCCFPVDAEFLTDRRARVAPGGLAWKWIKGGGCAVMRCYTGKIPHYVLLTAIMPRGEVGLYDPYAETPEFAEPDRRVIAGRPYDMNRAVRYDLLNLQETADYAMGPWDERELLLLRRKPRPAADS